MKHINRNGEPDHDYPEDSGTAFEESFEKGVGRFLFYNFAVCVVVGLVLVFGLVSLFCI